MNRAIRFYANEPIFLQQRQECMAGAGDDELGNQGESIAHSQTRGFQVGLGLIVRAMHAQDQVKRLLGSSLD